MKFYKINSILLIIAAIAIISFGISNTGRRLANAIFSPFIAVFNNGCYKINSTAQSIIISDAELTKQLQRQENQIIALQAQLADARQLREENRQLRQCIGLSDMPGWIAINAEVLSRNPATWQTAFTISAGTLDGIREGSVVLAQRHVIGRVTKCQAHSAEIHTIISSQCHFCVRVADTDAHGICSGNDGQGNFTINYLPKNLVPTSGQRLLTSGLGGWMPDGLEIGSIAINSKSPLTIDDSYIQVIGIPYSEFNDFKFVTVLVPNNKL